MMGAYLILAVISLARPADLGKMGAYQKKSDRLTLHRKEDLLALFLRTLFCCL
jgi:hypothetical protein